MPQENSAKQILGTLPSYNNVYSYRPIFKKKTTTKIRGKKNDNEQKTSKNHIGLFLLPTLLKETQRHPEKVLIISKVPCRKVVDEFGQ